jgi:hypothetical protein
VVPIRKLAIVIVASQQEVLYLLRFCCAHRPHPPFRKKDVDIDVTDVDIKVT